MDKVVWGSNATANYAYGLSDEEKKSFLLDRGYDPEMVETADLDSIISNDTYMWQDDSEEFDNEVMPMINNQTADGIVLMVGDAARWDGKHSGGKAAFVEDLKGGDVDPDVTEVEIVDDGEGLRWLGHHHDGTHNFALYAIPEDTWGFVESCMHDALDYELSFLDGDDPDFDDKAADEIFDHMTDLDYLNEHIDFEAVKTHCERIKNKLNESCEAYSNKQELNEVKTNNTDELTRELDAIKPLVDEYGYEYFIQMPFTAYENDPESIEYQYPEFFNIVKAYWKSMELLSKEDLNDSDLLDETWYTNTDKTDFDTIIRVAEKVAQGRNIQPEKEYMNGLPKEDKLDAEIEAERAAQEAEMAEFEAEENDELLDDLGEAWEDFDPAEIAKFKSVDLPKNDKLPNFKEVEVEAGQGVARKFAAKLENQGKNVYITLASIFCETDKYAKGDTPETIIKSGADCVIFDEYNRADSKTKQFIYTFAKNHPELDCYALTVKNDPNSSTDESLNEAVSDVVTVDLDFCDAQLPADEDKAIEYINNYFSKSGFNFKIIELCGPGGNWPEIEISGPREELKDWLSHYYFGDEYEGEELEDEFSNLIIESFVEGDEKHEYLIRYVDKGSDTTCEMYIDAGNPQEARRFAESEPYVFRVVDVIQNN